MIIRTRGKHWTPAQLATVARLASEGRTVGETAAALGTTRAAVRARCRRGLHRRPRFRNERGWTATADDVLRRSIEEGATRSEAADELGRSEANVSRRASALGVRFRGPQRDPLRISRVISFVARGADTAGKLAGLLGVSRQAANKAVAPLVRDGLLCRTGRGRARRLTVGHEWGTRA